MPRLRQHRAKLHEQTGRGRGATVRASGQGCEARGARLVGRGVEGSLAERADSLARPATRP
jgi:hypothetical protein